MSVETSLVDCNTDIFMPMKIIMSIITLCKVSNFSGGKESYESVLVLG